MQYLNKNLLTFCHDTLLQGHFFQVENLMVTCYIHYQIWTALNIFIKSPTPSICQEPALLEVVFWDRSAGYALYFGLSIRQHLLLLANPLSNSSMPSPSPTTPVPLPDPWPSAASQPRCPASSGCPCCPPGRTPWPTLGAGHNFPAFLQEDPPGQLVSNEAIGLLYYSESLSTLTSFSWKSHSWGTTHFTATMQPSVHITISYIIDIFQYILWLKQI